MSEGMTGTAAPAAATGGSTAAPAGGGSTATAAPAAPSAPTQTTAPATAEGSTSTPAPTWAPIERKLKVNGQEKTLKFETAEALDTYLQRGLGAEGNYQSAAKMRAEVKKELEALKAREAKFKANPRGALQEILPEGVNIEDVMMDVLRERATYEQMTPEQRELHDARKELEAHKAEVERFRQVEAQRAHEAEVTQLAQGFDRIRKGVLAKVGESKQAQRLTFDVMQEYIDAGMSPHMDGVLAEVEDRLSEIRQETAKSLTPEQIRQMLGPDGLKSFVQQEMTRTEVPPVATTPAVEPATGEGRGFDRRPGESIEEAMMRRREEVLRGR